MGVEKDIELPSQVVAGYHRIDSVPRFEWKEDGTGLIQLVISQYLSYEARVAGATPMKTTYKTLALDDNQTGILRYVIYKAILRLAPEFATSVDSQDGEIGNILTLMKRLDVDEIALLSLAMADVLALKGVDVEMYRPIYDTFKDEMLQQLAEG